MICNFMIFSESVGSGASLSAKVSVTSYKTTSCADFSFMGAPNLRQNFSDCRANCIKEKDTIIKYE